MWHLTFEANFAVPTLVSLSLGLQLWGKLATGHEDTQEVLWGVPGGDELRPPINSQHQYARYVNEPDGKQVAQPQSSLPLTAAPADILTAIS